MLDSNRNYQEYYNYLGNLMRSNTSDIVTIDYSRMDAETKEQIRNAINSISSNRRKELYKAFSGVQKYI